MKQVGTHQEDKTCCSAVNTKGRTTDYNSREHSCKDIMKKKKVKKLITENKPCLLFRFCPAGVDIHLYTKMKRGRLKVWTQNFIYQQVSSNKIFKILLFSDFCFCFDNDIFNKYEYVPSVIFHFPVRHVSDQGSRERDNYNKCYAAQQCFIYKSISLLILT